MAIDRSGSFDDDLGRDPERERRDAGDDIGSISRDRDSDRDRAMDWSPDDDFSQEWDSGILDEQGKLRYGSGEIDRLVGIDRYRAGGIESGSGRALENYIISVLIQVVGGPLLGAIYQSGPIGQALVKIGLGGYQLHSTMTDMIRTADRLGKLTGIEGLQHDKARSHIPEEGWQRSGSTRGLRGLTMVPPVPHAVAPQVSVGQLSYGRHSWAEPAGTGLDFDVPMTGMPRHNTYGNSFISSILSYG